MLAVLNLGFKGFFASLVAAALFGCVRVMTGATAAGFSRSDGKRSAALGYYIRWATAALWAVLRSLYQRWRMLRQLKAQDKAFRAGKTHRRSQSPHASSRAHSAAPKAGTIRPGSSSPPPKRTTIDVEMEDEDGEEDAEDEGNDEAFDARAGSLQRANAVIKQAKGGKRPRDASDYELPALTLLGRAQEDRPRADISPEILEQNAARSKACCEDFGVRGQIINVRPGPVVTLYELEPAPGIKSSRVIGLADDIARSMSAISARVAVVPGRNAIGIELPNRQARDGLPARASGLRGLREDQARIWRWRSARISAASRSSPISPACRIC